MWACALRYAKMRLMKYQAPRGTEDVTPGDSYRWLHVESKFREISQLYGYREIRTPVFEDTDLFLRTSGETSDVVSKEMYSFNDKGDRNITLKPELTAPAMRAVIEHSLCPPGTTLRMSYIGPIFRYGRPQRGRLREAHQVGLELVGSANPAAEAEILEVTDHFLRSVGLVQHRIQINCMGRDDCRAQYREVILNHVSAYLAEQTTEEREKAAKNPLRLLDTKDDKLRAVLEGLPSVLEYLEPESRADFEKLQELLTEANVPFQVDTSIVRGLDYYTGTVFEILHEALGPTSSLCGGGRYDGLIKQLGGAPTPSVGMGLGMERLFLCIDFEKVAEEAKRPDAVLVIVTPDAQVAGQKLARSLRKQGLEVITDVDGKSMKSVLRLADRVNSRFALILGTDEMATESVQVRDLSKGEQSLVPISEVAAALRHQP